VRARASATTAGRRSPAYHENIDAHRSCEGFAAFIGYAGHAEYVCTKPELHRTADAGNAGAAASAVDDRHRDELIAAAVERRRFLAGFLARGDQDVAATVLRQHLLDRAHRAVRALDWPPTLLGLPAEASTDTLAAAVEALTVNQLAILVDVLNHDHEDEALEYVDGWYGDDYDGEDYTAKWRERLVDLYGYSWSPAEQAMLDAQPTEQEQQDEAAAADVES
jgi:hypothetical protein